MSGGLGCTDAEIRYVLFVPYFGRVDEVVRRASEFVHNENLGVPLVIQLSVGPIEIEGSSLAPTTG